MLRLSKKMEQDSSTAPAKQAPWPIIFVLIAIVAIATWQFLSNDDEALPIKPEVEEVVNIPEPVPELETEVTEPETLPETPEPPVEPEPIVVAPTLPTLDESDDLVVEKLPELTWRKELIKLVVTDDIIRRFVVFTDNFAQGNLAYDNSPFVVPTEKFSAIEQSEGGNTTWQWDDSNSRRFSLYVDLMRSLDSDQLVALYKDMKPLFEEAYAELGYEDQNFDDIVQIAISRVLDLDIPTESPTLARPNVMYKYEDPELEALSDAEKLMLRIGRENILVVKSMLLEISDKLSRIEDN